MLDPYQWTEPRSLDKVARLIAEDRVNYVAPADYLPGSQLDVIVKGALQRIALRAGLPIAGDAEQKPSGQRGPGREMGPVDQHF